MGFNSAFKGLKLRSLHLQDHNGLVFTKTKYQGQSNFTLNVLVPSSTSQSLGRTHMTTNIVSFTPPVLGKTEPESFTNYKKIAQDMQY
jgi:hypothetical protein